MCKRLFSVAKIFIIIVAFSSLFSAQGAGPNVTSNINRICETIKSQAANFSYFNALPDSIKTTPLDMNPITEADFETYTIESDYPINEIYRKYANQSSKVKKEQCDGFLWGSKKECFLKYGVDVEFTEGASNCGYQVNHKLHVEAWVKRYWTEDYNYFQNDITLLFYSSDDKREYIKKDSIVDNPMKGLRNSSCSRIKNVLTTDKLYAALKESIKFEFREYESSKISMSMHENFNNTGINAIVAVNSAELQKFDNPTSPILAYPMYVSYEENAAKCNANISHTNPVSVSFSTQHDSDGLFSRGFEVDAVPAFSNEVQEGFKVTYNPGKTNKAIESVRSMACGWLNTVAWKDGAIGTSENLVFTIPDFGKDQILSYSKDGILRNVIENLFAGYRQDCTNCTGETIPHKIYGSIPFDAILTESESDPSFVTYTYVINSVPTIRYLTTVPADGVK